MKIERPELLRGVPATMAERDGSAVALHFGDPVRELAALSEDRGRVPVTWRGDLELVGPDRVRLLHGLVTCDVRPLRPGFGSYGYFTSLKGRVLADVAILALEDRFRLDLPLAVRDEIAAHVEKYLLAERVEVIRSEAFARWRIAGPDAEGALAELFGELPQAPWEHREVASGSRLVRGGRAGAPVFELLGAGSEVLSQLDEVGCRPVGFAAWEGWRIAAGRSRFGPDFGPETFPQEIGEEAEAVDYEKGCYLGQEVVARIHYRGDVQRRLAVVRLEGTAETATGTPLRFEGREAGRLGSVARNPEGGHSIGIALLHQRAATPGSELETEDGGRVRVERLAGSSA